MALNWENENLDAIVLAWYGGQNSGTAVADVLFGDYNPAGRLPITFYKSIEQLPDYEDYNMQGRTYRYFNDVPLYPFGFGLSYSNFKYVNGQLSSKQININQSIFIHFDVINQGHFDGDEVVQIYVKYPEHPKEPIQALKGFKRVNIKTGETKHIRMKLESNSFQTFNEELEEMNVVPGKYHILYGGSSNISSNLLELIIQ